MIDFGSVIVNVQVVIFLKAACLSCDRLAKGYQVLWQHLSVIVNCDPGWAHSPIERLTVPGPPIDDYHVNVTVTTICIALLVINIKSFATKLE